MMIDLVTLLAAAYRPSSACEAVTKQGPAAKAVSVVPTIEQTLGELVLKVTGAVPKPFVALNVCGVLSVVMFVGLKLVIDWAILLMVMDFATLVAAYRASSACEAVITQVPAPTTAKDVPTTVHTPVEFVLKVTGAVPGPLVALNVCGLLSTVMAVGLKTVIVWAALVIMIDLLILAGEY
jgi:hypothetical protein